jgi:hypothetical protein
VPTVDALLFTVEDVTSEDNAEDIQVVQVQMVDADELSKLDCWARLACDNNDFVALFLLLSCQLPLLAVIFSEAKMKHFLN